MAERGVCNSVANNRSLRQMLHSTSYSARLREALRPIACAFWIIFCVVSVRSEFTFTSFNGYARVMSYVGPETHVVIPSTLAGMQVVGVGKNFQLQDHVTEISIPASVNSMDDYMEGGVFHNCKGLLRINVAPESAYYASLDGVLFDKWMTRLIDYPRGRVGPYTIPNGVDTIDYSAFRYARGLTAITMAPSVIRIKQYAFASCDQLAAANLNNGLRDIAWGAFGGCDSLTDFLLPASVTSATRFLSSSRLVSVRVDPANSSFSSEGGILYNRDKTTVLLCPPKAVSGSYTIRTGVYSVGAGAFGFCVDLTNISFPTSVYEISTDAFFGCSGLTRVNIPTSVYEIGNTAFANCARLAEVSLPSTLARLGNGAFAGCPLLEQVAIPGSVAEMGYATFRNCASLRSVVLGEGLRSIGSGAFDGCTSLRTVLLPESLQSIGDSAFRSCPITEVRLPRNVSSLDMYVFADCAELAAITVDAANLNFAAAEGVLFDKSLSILTVYPPAKSSTDYSIPGSVTEIRSGAFGKALNLLSISISASTVRIEKGEFAECRNLASILVDPENTAFNSSDGVMFNKTKTTLFHFPPGKPGDYVVPDSVEVIEFRSFTSAWRLTNLHLPARVNTIYPETFGGCENLAAFAVDPLNGSYRAVDGVLFDSQIRTLVRFPGGKGPDYRIPAGTVTVGRAAFMASPNLRSVFVPASTIVFGDFAFLACDRLEGIYFEGNYSSAFEPGFYNLTTPPTAYYMPGSTGWESNSYAGQKILWNPSTSTTDGAFGARADGFGFTVNGSPGLRIVVEASVDLSQPEWVAVGEIVLEGGSADFRDPSWLGRGARFYRFRSP